MLYFLLNLTSSWDFVIFREYQGQDAIFGAVYAHKGGTKKLKRHGLHGFALDQPSINGIGPINRSQNPRSSLNFIRNIIIMIIILIIAIIIIIKF